MSLLGKHIPKFNLAAFYNNEFITVSDTDFLGNWNILMFYPGDFTYICPTELADLQEYYEQLQKRNVNIYACSADTHLVHKKWYDSTDSPIKDITFPLIGDPDCQLIKEFDVYDEEEEIAQRGTFIIDPYGKIISIDINNNNIGRDASSYLDTIEAAQYLADHPHEMCPAKWKKTHQTIIPDLNIDDLL